MSSIQTPSDLATTAINMTSTTTTVPPSPASKAKTSTPQKKKSTSLPAETVDYLKAWMMSPEHIAHPYPTEQEKAQIMTDTGIELKQLTNWFVNNRKRYWKPRVEARLQQQVQLPAASVATAAAVSMAPIKRKSSSQQLAPIDVNVPSLPPALSSLGATVAKKDDRIRFVRSTSQESLPTASPGASFLRSVSGQDLHQQVVVSDASSSASCASDSGSDFSSANEDELMINFDSNEDVVGDGAVARTETVDVHILRPLNGVKPTIADVSILSTVPSERILCTFENVMLTYRFTVDSIQDRKKVQNRRDAEIVRLKRRYLKLFIESGMTAPKRGRQERETTPRKKFRRESLEMWREACVTAHDIYDHDLPTLEEATLLFGFSKGISA